MSIYIVSSDKNILNVARATEGLDLNTRNQYFATILGWDAGYNNRGLYNTFIGYQTAYNAVNGSYNTCVGALAGYAVNDTSNIFMGYATGQNLESGKNNIFVGNQAGQNLNMSSNNILIGHRNTVASAPFANLQNNLALGNFTKVGGHSNITVGNGSSNLSLDSLVVGNSVVNMDVNGLARDTTRNSIILGNHIENYGSNVLILNNIHNSNYALVNAGCNVPKLVNFSNEYMNLNDAVIVQRTWQPALSNQSKLTLQNDIVVLSARNGLLEMQDGHIRMTPSPCNGQIQLNAEVCVRDRIHLSRCNYTDHHWDIYLDNRGSSNTSDLVMKSKNNTVVTFTDTFAAEQLNFTGKHRCRSVVQRDEGMVGKIVVATGTYCDLNGVEDVFIDEAIPVVDLCRVAKDARAFGVVAGWEAEGTGERSYKLGHMEFSHPLPNAAAPRVIVNSHGEGGIWVCNANGVLRNGDLITTSAVPGYGMRQTSKVVKSYTVAKITCDCLFQEGAVVVQGGRRLRAAFVGCVYKF